MIHNAFRILAALSVCSTFAIAANPIIAIYGGANGETNDRAVEVGLDVIYPSVSWYEPQPWLAQVTENAHAKGIKVYPSLASAYDGYGDKHHQFAAAHPECWEQRKDGTVLDRGEFVNLSWGYPEVRKYKVETFTEFVRQTGVDGILLDYTRFFGNDSGYSPIIVEAFKKKYRKDPFKLANDDPEWVQFRANYVTEFVRELRASLGTLGRKVELIACVGPNPDETLQNNLQDWRGWVDEGLVDGVTVMIYERDTNNTIAQLLVSKAAIKGRVPLIALIAPEYDNLPTPDLIREGSRKSLQAGADGVGYYHEGSVIRLKLGDAIKDVAHWDVDEIRTEPVDYLLNSGFERGLENWAIGYGRGVKIVPASKVADGGHAIQLDLPESDGIRQVVDRGFISEGNAIRVTGKALLDSTTPTSLLVDVTVAFHKGKEASFRVPVVLNPSEQWQDISANVSLPKTNDIKFIYLAIHPENKGDGHVLLDDLDLNVTTADVTAGQFAIQGSSPAPAGKDVNIVRGEVVRGTSFWENGFDYDNAVDGDLSSADYGRNAAWHSQRPAMDQSITIYLPAIHRISRIRLLNSSAQAAYRTDQYKIEASTDGQTYRPVASGRLPDDGTTWTEIKINPTSAKYIRFTGVRGFNLPYAVGLKEIEVYDSP
jgi:hypothetical protein